jgi:hypothetical protein
MHKNYLYIIDKITINILNDILNFNFDNLYFHKIDDYYLMIEN